jgi:ABC-type phosphate transport system auxiliary subunit
MLDDEVVAKATADAPGMSWRVPLAMAFWGFVLVVAFEMMAGFWRKPVVMSTTNRPLSTDAAELAVQQFLREAEAKAANLDQTPLPGNQKASVNSTVIGRI